MQRHTARYCSQRDNKRVKGAQQSDPNHKGCYRKDHVLALIADKPGHGLFSYAIDHGVSTSPWLEASLVSRAAYDAAEEKKLKKYDRLAKDQLGITSVQSKSSGLCF
jgi:hypothetical protein